MKTQLQELEEAAREGRQPLCVGCKKPLDVVCQQSSSYFYWEWNDKEKRYRQSDDFGDADKPFHVECDWADWDLVESGEATARLGLDY